MESAAEPLPEHGPFRDGAIPAVTPEEILAWFALEDDFVRIGHDNERRADGADAWRMVPDDDVRRRLQAFRRRTGAAPARVATIGTRVDLLYRACGADPSPTDDRAATIAAPRVANGAAA